MYSSVYIHFLATPNNRNVLHMFFEDWADNICNSNVKYSIVGGDGGGLSSWNEIIRVDFDTEEDATAMLLKGIPNDLQKYLKFTDAPQFL